MLAYICLLFWRIFKDLEEALGLGYVQGWVPMVPMVPRPKKLLRLLPQLRSSLPPCHDWAETMCRSYEERETRVKSIYNSV